MGKRKQLTFKASMGCGDMIYSLCVVKAICEKENAIGVYYIEQSKYTSLDTYQACKRLFEHQDYIQSCERYHKQGVHYNFDRARPIDTQKPIISQFADLFGIEVDYMKPWLKGIYYETGLYRFCNITPRYDQINVSGFLNIASNCIFLGTEDDYDYYNKRFVYDTNRLFHENHIENLATLDLFEVYKLLSNCEYLVCNQSAILTIAQGLNKSVYLAKDKRFNNTVLGKETII